MIKELRHVVSQHHEDRSGCRSRGGRLARPLGASGPARHAQGFLDYILKLHFIDLPLRVARFDWATAGALVGVTALLGFIAGALFALAWNGLNSRSKAGMAR